MDEGVGGDGGGGGQYTKRLQKSVERCVVWYIHKCQRPAWLNTVIDQLAWSLGTLGAVGVRVEELWRNALKK